MSGIMFNEDCTHFAYDRLAAGKSAGLKELQAFIDQYTGTQVTEFILNLNAMIAWFYPSETRENAVDKYTQWLANGMPMDDVGPIGKVLREIGAENGLDMYKVWIDRLREKSISPWISIRMNDIHNASEHNHFLISQFYRDHLEMRRGAHRPASSYFDTALDYSRPEVREHYLALIREVAGRYDFDGLELDWMREPFTLAIGAELDGAKIITDFMHEVRAALDLAETAYGHRIKMSARVPYTPEVALRFGFDVLEWARTGLVDLIVVTPRWQTTDTDMPIDLWKKMLAGTNVILAAGLEINTRSVRSSTEALFNSVETARGCAAEYFGMGADRIYLFNFFDSLNPAAGAYNAPENYQRLLTTIGDLETASSLPRRHLVTFHDVTAPGLRLADLLPALCKPRGFQDFRIATGPIPPAAKIRLILGVDLAEDMDETDFKVFANSAPCIFKGPCTPPFPAASYRMYEFEVPNRAGFPQASVIEIAAAKRPFTLTWMEIAVD